jgi:hypothetical protein
MLFAENKRRRWAESFCVVGAKGTGKTTFCLARAEQIRRQFGRKLLVFTKTSDERFDSFESVSYTELADLEQGGRYVINPLSLRGLKGDGRAELLEALSTDFVDGTLIIDDATAIIPRVSTYACEDLLNNTRHKSRDIIFCYHFYNKIPAWIVGMFNWFVMLPSPIRPGDNLKDFVRYKQLCRTYDVIQSKHEQNVQMGIQRPVYSIIKAD